MRVVVALAILVLGAQLALAQSKIPSREMPGRERERFIDSPVERFMRAGPQNALPVIDPPRASHKPQKRRKRHHTR
jgi:hypothetical protein